MAYVTPTTITAYVQAIGYLATVQPLYCGHIGDLVKCLYREVSLFQG